MSDALNKTKVDASKNTVSVVMCTYNGARYVKEQLDSILSQTYPLHEVLIFDDRSTDETVSIIQKTIEDFPFAKLFVNPKNLGFEKNFAHALQAASGELIAISDQDDIWLQQKIEKLVNAWKPECPLIYGASKPFEGKPPEKDLHPDSHYRHFEGTDGRKIFFRNTISGHNLMIRKSFLPSVLPLPTDTYYDWFLAVAAAYNGGVQYYPAVLVLHRIHGENATFDSNMKGRNYSLRSKMSVIDATRSFLRIAELPPAHKSFAIKLHDLLQESLNQEFSTPLFMFLFKHRTLLFNYKRRKIGLFSHLKHSRRIAKKSNN